MWVGVLLDGWRIRWSEIRVMQHGMALAVHSDDESSLSSALCNDDDKYDEDEQKNDVTEVQSHA